MTKEDLIKTINHLVGSNSVLSAHFGHTVTLGEMLVTLVRQQLHLTGQQVTVSRLADLTGYARSTISSMVRRNPMLKMNPHPDDDRVKVITVTDAGHDLSYIEKIVTNAREIQYDQGFIETDSLKEAIAKHLDAVGVINARSRPEHQISREE